MNAIQLIVSILLPPLGVFLTVGFGTAFIINVLLTLLGWLPGVIHALWIATKEAERTNARY
ncbi:MAG: YqaE/Pmp3 family membrane protein [Xenococcaceae cyanobacterium]|jgi:uncharacterized membrane protein YqaE (UPF0057 family)